jgi:2-dehydropantoate 2-reductase
MEALYVVGAGGIGCAIGYALAIACARVVFIEANREKVEWGKAHGVRVDERPAQAAEVRSFEEWNPSVPATVFLCTKCYDNSAVLARLPEAIALIPIQNGFDRALEARGHAIEGIASFVSECHPNRLHSRITRRGTLHIGYRGVPKDLPTFEWIDRLQRAGLFPIRLVPDILPYKYTKLMYNAAISPLASIAGLDNGQILWLPKARRLFFALLRENYGILRECGITLGTIGPFHPDTVERILKVSPLAKVMSWTFYPSLRGSYCSMSGDLPRGRTEIDYYNGRLIEMAGESPCPLNQAVYQLIKRMERERIPPGQQMLRALIADVGI